MPTFEIILDHSDLNDLAIWKRVIIQVPDGERFEVYSGGRVAVGHRAGRDIYLQRLNLPERCVNFD